MRTVNPDAEDGMKECQALNRMGDACPATMEESCSSNLNSMTSALIVLNDQGGVS